LINPNYPHPIAGDTNVITSVSLSASAITGNAHFPAQEFVDVFQTFCIGSGPCNQGPTAANNTISLEAAFTNNSSSPTYTCLARASANAICGSASSSSPIVVALQIPVTTLNIQYQYEISADGSTTNTNTTSTLNNFTTIFGEGEGIVTPEPSSFRLLCAALAALATFRLRRYKADKPSQLG
jgi:hypothetical protein